RSPVAAPRSADACSQLTQAGRAGRVYSVEIGSGFDLPVGIRSQVVFRRIPVFRIAFGTLTLLAILGVTARGAGPDPKEVKAAVEKAYAYLKSAQAEDGSFAAKQGGPGVTALIAAGLIRNGYPADDPVVAKALKFVEKFVQKDGGIYNKQLANYMTCVALTAFKEANVNGRYDAVIANATKFLKSLPGDPGDES